MIDSLSKRRVEVESRAVALCEQLAHHELDVLRLVALGLLAKAIAGELKLREDSVDQYIRTITTKIGVRGRVNMARLALQAGLASLWEDWKPEVHSGKQQAEREAAVPRRAKDHADVHAA